MKRIDDLTFINNINDAICENRIFALRIKKGNPYFLGLMERSAKIAYSFVVNLEDCLLQKESVLCGTLQDNIDHVLNHEIFASELRNKFRGGPLSVAEAFLKRIECHKRKGEFDSEDHDIFMVSDTEFNNIVDTLRDGDYIFVIKDNDPVDDLETNCFESVDVSPKKLSYDKPNPPISVNTENSLPETYTVISYWIGERESSKVWLYNTYKEATEGMERLWERSYNLALEDEDFDEKNSYHEESFGVIVWGDNRLRRCFEVVNTSKTENIL